MPRIRTLVLLILAGGAPAGASSCSRTGAQAGRPFAGTHRLIDFPLSNCHELRRSATCGLRPAVQPVPRWRSPSPTGGPGTSTARHGGLLLLHPREGHDGRGGFAAGHRRRAVAQRRADPRVRARGARRRLERRRGLQARLRRVWSSSTARRCGPSTMVTTEVEPEDAGRYGVVQTAGGKGADYALQAGRADRQPDRQRGRRLRAPDRVLDTLDELAEEAGDEGVPEDLGHERAAAAGRRRRSPRAPPRRLLARRRDGRRLLGGPLELLPTSPRSTSTIRTWPILTHATTIRASGRSARPEPRLERLIAPGAPVAGSVECERRRARREVEPGAVVRGAILLPEASSAPARWSSAILDDHVEVRGAVGGRTARSRWSACGPPWPGRESNTPGRRALPRARGVITGRAP